MDFKIAVRLAVPLAIALFLSACASTQDIASENAADAASNKQNEDDDLDEVFAWLSQGEEQLDSFLVDLAAQLDEEANKEEQTIWSGAADGAFRIEKVWYDPDKNRLTWEVVTTAQDIRIIPHRFHNSVCGIPFYAGLLREFDVAVVQDIYYNNVKEGDVVVTDCK